MCVEGVLSESVLSMRCGQSFLCAVWTIILVAWSIHREFAEGQSITEEQIQAFASLPDSLTELRAEAATLKAQADNILVSSGVLQQYRERQVQIQELRGQQEAQTLALETAQVWFGKGCAHIVYCCMYCIHGLYCMYMNVRCILLCILYTWMLYVHECTLYTAVCMDSNLAYCCMATHQHSQREMDELKQQWLPELQRRVGMISSSFGESFKRVGCAGEVVLITPDDDVNKFAIEIKYVLLMYILLMVHNSVVVCVVVLVKNKIMHALKSQGQVSRGRGTACPHCQ